MFAAFLLLTLAQVLGGVAIFAAYAVVRMRHGHRVVGSQLGQQGLANPTVSLCMLVLGAAAAIPLAFLLARPRPWRQRLLLKRPRRAIGYTACLIFASLGTVELSGILIRAFVHDHLSATVRGMFTELSKQSGSRAFVVYALAIVLVPLGEELFFRGLLQVRLVERWGPAVGIFVTSLLWAVLHLNWAQSFNALALGLVLGWVAWRCGSIWPGVVGHGVINALAFTGMRFLTVSPKGSGQQHLGYVLWLATSFLLLAVGMELRWRRTDRQRLLAARSRA